MEPHHHKRIISIVTILIVVIVIIIGVAASLGQREVGVPNTEPVKSDKEKIIDSMNAPANGQSAVEKPESFEIVESMSASRNSTPAESEARLDLLRQN